MTVMPGWPSEAAITQHLGVERLTMGENNAAVAALGLYEAMRSGPDHRTCVSLAHRYRLAWRSARRRALAALPASVDHAARASSGDES